MPVEIRAARDEDLAAIVAIYNQAVAARRTADVEPVTLAGRRGWLSDHTADRHPVLAAELGGRVVGWASLSAYRPGRGALRRTAEVSYYVDASHRRQGIGRALVAECLRRAPELHLDVLFAILLEDNLPSIRLLESMGFARWGHLPEVADFGDRRVGHLYYGRRVGG